MCEYCGCREVPAITELRDEHHRLLDQVDHVSFTGSTAAGRVVGAQAGQALVPATLELGGKNPLYVAEDVDVEVAARGAVRACFSGTSRMRRKKRMSFGFEPGQPPSM